MRLLLLSQLFGWFLEAAFVFGVIVEMDIGGMSHRDIEYGLERAIGQFILSQSTGL